MNERARPESLGTSLENSPFFMPFSMNRAFKKAPRLLARAEGMYYYTPEGRKILDGTSGLWCVNAGHCRKQIVEAVQRGVATLDYSPPCFGWPRENAFFAGSCVWRMWSTPVTSAPKILRLPTMPPTAVPPKLTPW